MSLMDAPQYDAKKEARTKNIFIGSLVAVVLIIAIALSGFFMGHGWFFINVPAEMRVNKFLNTVEAGDFNKAYGIWMNDAEWQQHPQQFDYSLQRFTEDWSTKSDYGPIHSHKVNFSHRDHSSIIVGVTINGSPDMLFLLYETKHDTLSFSPVKLAY
ncbi:MAG: hypothetical protein P4L10_04970 [Acidobacteriaceae bacterium]|jgi:hypothetical protein|nr:hypothetical protein [Acidobacteriaceae bacterium]